MNLEGYKGKFALRVGVREAIIVRILKKLKNEPGVASIYMFGKTGEDKLGRFWYFKVFFETKF